MATVKYVYVGDVSEIIGPGARRFEKYGEVVDLDQSLAEALIADPQRLPLLTLDQFELSGPVPDSKKDPAAHEAHRHASRLSLHEFRTALTANLAAQKEAV